MEEVTDIAQVTKTLGIKFVEKQKKKVRLVIVTKRSRKYNGCDLPVGSLVCRPALAPAVTLVSSM